MQDIEQLRLHILGYGGATEGLPFGPGALVFKVMGKMFALLSLDEAPPAVNLKCEPERALVLREAHPEHILPGYHMNKQHWNTLVLDGALPPALVLELVAHSYTLVVSGLPKKAQAELADATRG